MSKSKGRLHIHAESADNGGYSVSSHVEPTDKSAGMSPMGMGGGTKETFGDHAAAHAHIGKLMAKHAGAPAPSDNDADDTGYGRAKSAFGRMAGR